MPVKHIAVPGHTHQSGQIDVGDKIPPVQVGVIPHDLDPYIGGTLVDLVYDKIRVLFRGLVVQTGPHQPGGGPSGIVLDVIAGADKHLHVIAALLPPDPVRPCVLGRRLVHTDQPGQPVIAEELDIAPENGGPHRPPQNRHVLYIQMIQQIFHVHGISGDPMAVKDLLRLSMASHIHTDHLKMSGQFLRIVFPELRGTGPPWKHEQRRALARYLIVDLHIVVGLKCCHKISLLCT